MLREAPEEVEVLARIELMRSAGLSYQRIADALNDEGVAARGSRWHKQTIVRICQN